LDRELKGKERQVAGRVLEALVTYDTRRVVISWENLQKAVELEQSSLLDYVLKVLYDNRLVRRELDENDDPVYELAHDYLLHEIELDPETQTRKLAQEMLDDDVRVWQQNLPDKEVLIAEDRFDIINSQRDSLNIDATAAELLGKSEATIEAERQRETERQQALTEEQRKRAEEAEARQEAEEEARRQAEARAAMLKLPQKRSARAAPGCAVCFLGWRLS
jgi:hypothetical protein